MRRIPYAAVGSSVVVLLAVVCSGAFSRDQNQTRHEPPPNTPTEVPDFSFKSLGASHQVKRVIARRVFHERLSLLAAAELFREANGREGLARLRATHLSGTLQEHLCRQVIAFIGPLEAEQAGRERPPEAGYTAGLETELNRLLAAGAFAASEL